MEIEKIIERIDSDRRHFVGAFFVKSQPQARNGFEATIKLVQGEEEIYFEGGVIRGHNLAPISFRFSIPRANIHLAGSKGQLDCPALGEIVGGQLLTSGDGFEFLGQNKHITYSLHLQFAEENNFIISGMFRTQNTMIAFSAAQKEKWDASVESNAGALKLNEKKEDVELF